MFKTQCIIRYFCSTNFSQLINPYTHELLNKKQYISDSQLFTRITQATNAQKIWQQQSLNHRIEHTQNLVRSIIADKKILQQIIASELGKSYKNISKEFQRVDTVAWELIQSGRDYLQPKIIRDDNQKYEKLFQESLGLTLIFPFFSEPIFDSVIQLIPCLISGGGALIKSSDFNHFLGGYLSKKADETLGVKSLISDIFVQPNDLANLAQFRFLKKVVYSGSQTSARHIFQTLVKNRFIDCNLFFGGQDAAYVDETADIQKTVKQIVKISFYNNGQSYDCVKRLYLHQSIKQQFQNQLVEEVQKLVIGNPHDPATDLGPLCVQQISPTIQKYINDAVNDTAQCLIGGMLTTDGQSSGVFCQPTILTNCTSDMLIVQTQLPAPVLSILQVSSNDQFVQMVNQANYGTGVRIFTKDPSKYEKFIDQLEVGRISFNSASILNCNLPIEGWKKSGKGKILSEYGFHQYVLPKIYNINRKSMKK